MSTSKKRKNSEAVESRNNSSTCQFVSFWLFGFPDFFPFEEKNLHFFSHFAIQFYAIAKTFETHFPRAQRSEVFWSSEPFCFWLFLAKSNSNSSLKIKLHQASNSSISSSNFFYTKIGVKISQNFDFGLNLIFSSIFALLFVYFSYL